MAWPTLRFDQANLALLCAPRHTYASEYHIQNELYGQAALVKEYAGLPPDEPLPWAMEHAISFDDAEQALPEHDTRLPIVLAVSPGQADIMRRKVAARVEAVGSSFFYMRALWRRRGLPEDPPGARRGTLVFPDKSTVHQRTDYDRERFARDLAALPAAFQPVVVSVFWKDFELGDHRPFARAGLPVVTSGHSYDPLFLFRLLDLCRQFTFACANDLSTSFCLSVLAGCRFFHWPTGPLQVTRAGQTRRFEREPTFALPGKQACLAASPFPPVDNPAEQRALAELFAGQASVRPPEFFRELRTAGRRLLQAAAPPALQFAPGGRTDGAAGWLMRGVDADGWARGECGFAIPPALGHAGVRLTLDVPPRPDPQWSGRWRLALDERDVALDIRAGCWLLDLPSRGGGEACRVTIRSDDGQTLPGETRSRAFRLCRIDAIGPVAAPSLRQSDAARP